MRYRPGGCGSSHWCDILLHYSAHLCDIVIALRSQLYNLIVLWDDIRALVSSQLIALDNA